MIIIIFLFTLYFVFKCFAADVVNNDKDYAANVQIRVILTTAYFSNRWNADIFEVSLDGTACNCASDVNHASSLRLLAHRQQSMMAQFCCLSNSCSLTVQLIVSVSLEQIIPSFIYSSTCCKRC